MKWIVTMFAAGVALGGASYFFATQGGFVLGMGALGLGFLSFVALLLGLVAILDKVE